MSLGARARLLVAGVLAAMGTAALGEAVWIRGKAHAAQVLIERAWERSAAGAERAAPWPWADTSPVARLTAPRLGVSRMVLAGATGRTLAFGPALLDGAARPGTAGHTIVVGHRDTHFAFLEDLAPGDALLVDLPDGRHERYRVAGATVIDHHELAVEAAPAVPTLSLVTCFPFDAVAPGGPLRYVVTAQLEAAPPPGASS